MTTLQLTVICVQLTIPQQSVTLISTIDDNIDSAKPVVVDMTEETESTDVEIENKDCFLVYLPDGSMTNAFNGSKSSKLDFSN